jgi:hypothetical protein
MSIFRVMIAAACLLLLASLGLALIPVSGNLGARTAAGVTPQPDIEHRTEATRFSSPLMFDQSDIFLANMQTAEQVIIAEPVVTRRIVLTGIARDDAGALAWMGVEGVAAHPLRLGDEIGGWRVLRIDPTEVELYRDEDRQVLRLFAGQNP